MRLAACILGRARWRHGCSRDETKYSVLQFRSHSCFNCTVDYDHHLVKCDVLVFHQTFDEWMGPKVLHIFQIMESDVCEGVSNANILLSTRWPFNSYHNVANQMWIYCKTFEPCFFRSLTFYCEVYLLTNSTQTFWDAIHTKINSLAVWIIVSLHSITFYLSQWRYVTKAQRSCEI